MRIQHLLASVLLVLAGAAAGRIGESGRRPAPRSDELDLATTPFRLERTVANPLLVTPDKWLELPMLRADFDLLADFELGEGARLDLLVRRVEPRPLQGTSLGFHGRFATLRLSSVDSGPAWRDREDALFGAPGGIKLLAGSPATVTIQARGRRLLANVAGRVLPEFSAADEHGGLALAARGGTVAVRALQITPVNVGGPPRAGWLATAGGLVLAGIAWRRRRPGQALIAAAVLVLVPMLLRDVAFAALPPLAQPDAVDEWRLALAGLPLALAALASGRTIAVVALAGVAVAGWSVHSVRQDLHARFPATPELDAVLGPDSRETAAELLAQRVRGPNAIHTVAEHPRRVLLLGGQLLYRRGAAPDQHVETLLLGELRRSANPDVDVVAAPTEDGWSLQQWRLCDRFLRGFRPRVLVFGVPRAEDAVDPATGRPRSSPAVLADTIAAVHRFCEQGECRLVLLIDDGVAGELVAAARTAAGEAIPFVQLSAGDAAIGVARKLDAVLAPLLR